MECIWPVLNEHEIKYWNVCFPGKIRFISTFDNESVAVQSCSVEELDVKVMGKSNPQYGIGVEANIYKDWPMHVVNRF